MIKKLKSNILTYLFKDWVSNETDVETLQITKVMINQREETLTGVSNSGRAVIQGFRNVG